VGFTLIALGLSSATVSIMYGKVVKCIPRFLVVLLGAAINVILLVFLFVWERVPSYEVIFAFAVGWGAADAVCHNVSCSRLFYMHKNEQCYLVSFQTQSSYPAFVVCYTRLGRSLGANEVQYQLLCTAGQYR